MTWVDKHTILLATVGSTLHGTSISEDSDRDEMGICIEPQSYIIGLDQFDSHVFRTAVERYHMRLAIGGTPLPPGHEPTSHPGDVDRTVYGLRKFCRLALNGNPNLISLLFAPADKIETRIGKRLQSLSDLFVSRRCGEAFRGYLTAQKHRLLGERGQKDVNRPELVAAHGYDTKFAYHAVRLGMQGIELMQTGRLSEPMRDLDRQLLCDIRRGEFTLEHVIKLIEFLENALTGMLAKSGMKPEGDIARINTFLAAAYEEHWKSHQFDEQAAA